MSNTPSTTDSDAALRDPLTSAYSRVSMAQRLQEEVERAFRYGESLSLLVLDLDHFKSVNDAFGHTRGDEVLIEFVARVQALTRASDVLFRLGGDEFVLLLPNTPEDHALALARRLLAKIQATTFAGEPPLSLSLSIGVATLPADAFNASMLFEKADARANDAKRRGRAQVVGADETLPNASPFVETSRLIEREHAMATLYQFLDALPIHRRGMLLVHGAYGAGRSRFLTELNKLARLRGYDVIELRGQAALRAQPYGVLTVATHSDYGLPWSTPDGLAWAQTLPQRVAERGKQGLVFSVDDWSEVDVATLELLDELLHASELPVLAVACVTDQSSSWRLISLPPPLHLTVELQGFSLDGVRVWLRSVLQWEAPSEFREWLLHETDGLPVLLHQAISQLIAQGLLAKLEGRWQLNPAYADIQLNLKPPTPRPTTPNNLPILFTSFVGREREIVEVALRLTRHRLVTLHGPGGAGKTRLALEAATRLLTEFPDGVYFVALAAVTAPELVLQTLAHTLGVVEVAGEACLDTLTRSLQGKRLLALLDNFEQVSEAASHITALLTALPQLTILVTSRSRLRIADEHVFAVPPLPLPSFIPSRFSAARLMQYAGVRLFVERARAAKPNFTITTDNAAAVIGIGARLDGLPLALELAAARVRLLSPDEILARLAHSLTLLTGGAIEMHPHQRTLRATLDWSYGLLSPWEQRLFAQLAIFNGSFTAQAAEVVCQLDAQPPLSVLDALASLMDQNLIRMAEGVESEPRLTMLHVIREYALEHLHRSGAAALLRQRHADFYIRWTMRAEPELFGAQSHVWLERIEQEHDNVRAALRWLLDHQQAEQAGRIGGVLARFWDARGYSSEGRQWLTLILDAAADLSDVVRAQTLYASGWLALRQGDYAVATPAFEESLRLFRSLKEPLGIAKALHGLGGVALELADYPRAQPYFEESLALRRAANDLWAISNSLLSLGKLARNQGDYARAIVLLEESLALGRQVGERSSIAFALRSLGRTLSLQGDWQRAAAMHRESLRLTHELNHKIGMIEALDGIAEVAVTLGQWPRAARLYGAAEAIRHAIGAPIPPVSKPIYEEYWGKVRAALDAQTFQREWETGRMMTLEQVVSYALEQK